MLPVEHDVEWWTRERARKRKQVCKLCNDSRSATNPRGPGRGVEPKTWVQVASGPKLAEWVPSTCRYGAPYMAPCRPKSLPLPFSGRFSGVGADLRKLQHLDFNCHQHHQLPAFGYPFHVSMVFLLRATEDHLIYSLSHP